MGKLRPTRGGGVNTPRGGRQRIAYRGGRGRKRNNPAPEKPIECTECNKPGPIYKCPKCFQKYCSVACCKEHKLKCSSPVNLPSEQIIASTGCTKCDKPDPTYKCPTCSKKYCSTDCCTEHKTQCVTPATKRQYNYEFPTEDTVPLEKLMKIKDDERIHSLLKSSKLRALIVKLDEMQNPANSFRNLMTDPEFRAFSDTVLDIVGVKDDYNIP